MGWIAWRKQREAGWGVWGDIAGSGAETTPYVVTGLENGVAYLFRLRAVNACAKSAANEAEEFFPIRFACPVLLTSEALTGPGPVPRPATRWSRSIYRRIHRCMHP